MNKIKKICSVLLSIIVLMTAVLAVPLNTYAIETPALSVENKVVTAGETVTVPIKIAGSSDVYNGNFTLQYDSSKLEVQSYEYGTIFDEHTKNCNLDYQSTGNQIRFTFSGAYRLKSDGTLVAFTFKVKENVSGTASLDFTAYKMYDENGVSLAANAANGNVEISSNNLTGYVNGKTVHVGDIVTYKIDITADEILENFQANLLYTGDVLKVIESDDMFPILRCDECSENGRSPLVFNTNLENHIIFNASDIHEHYDFRNGGTLLNINFEVVSAGSAEISLDIEVMSSADSKYVAKGEVLKSYTICETLVNSNIDNTNPTEPQPTEPVAEILCGDVNGDGKVNVKDVTLIQKYAADIEPLTDEQKKAADVNVDEKVNIKDATAIQKYVAGIETGLLIGTMI